MADLDIFAQLQALSTLTAETTVDMQRKRLGEIVEFFKARNDYYELVRIFAEEVRNLKVQTLLDADSFMVQDININEIPEELRHDSLGFCKGIQLVFDGRYVYPVKDVRGQVMGFCGYDKFSDIKYLDSVNHGYKAKEYSMYGMEALPEYYRSADPVYIVEGIVCCLYLRQEGLQSLAMLGSNLTPYCTEIVRRFGHRAIFVCDSDEAGTTFRRRTRYRLPQARFVQSRIAKDVDDSRQVNENFAKELSRLKNPFSYSSSYS